ncbi:eCIS core domain-containing protein [Paenibacillus sp. strain BS8-2]
MKETEKKRHNVLQRSVRAATPSRRKENNHSALHLAQMQASAGNQAVLQRFKEDNAAEKESSPQSAPSVSGSGAILPTAVQIKMERSLGADFSDVRIHTGTQANKVGALAYTQGSDIHFAPGEYNPESQSGQQLLGHELTHVVQQKEGRVSPTAQLATGHQLNDNPALESEADRLGAKAAASSDFESAPIQQAASPSLDNSSSDSDPVMQRMPRPSDVKNKLGEPKEPVHHPIHNRFAKQLGVTDTLKQNSTHYRALLQKLENLDRFIDGEIVGDTPDIISSQLNVIMTLYSEVEQVSEAYIKHNDGDKKDPKLVYIKKLKETLSFEKNAIRSASAEYKIDQAKERPYWKLLTGSTKLQLNESMDSGTSGSGEMSMVAAGIASADAQMVSRNSAMHRLASLLNTGAIDRAEFALVQSGEGIIKGSYMDKVKGKSAEQLLNPAPDDIEEGKEDTFDINSPAFQLTLSRLQLIDTIAMQIDSNVGSFFIHRDEFGNVLSVTDIDNEMAFGKQTEQLDVWQMEYPNVSKLVDKELAEQIIALKSDELRLIMEDLLSPAEVDALIERIIKLQTYLKKEATRLLDKQEWIQVHERIRKGNDGREESSAPLAQRSHGSTEEEPETESVD